MSNINLADIPQIEYPRLVIYLIYPFQLEGLMKGKARITNLPEDAKIYKVVPWMPDQCDSAIAVWFSHPSFDESYPGALVQTKYLHWEEALDITKLPIVETREYRPLTEPVEPRPVPSGPEDYYFNK